MTPTHPNLERVAALLRRACPRDLPEAVGVYVETPESVGLGRIDGADGWTNCGLDVQLRERLEAEGRWRGRGFACAVQGSLDFGHVLDVVAHEFSHWLEGQARRVPMAMLPTAAAERLIDRVRIVRPDVVTAAWRDRPHPVEGLAGDALFAARLRQVRDHATTFQRGLFHVRHRLAKVTGTRVAEHVHGEWLAHPRAVGQLLQAELERTLDDETPLTELLRTPVCPEFEALTGGVSWD